MSDPSLSPATLKDRLSAGAFAVLMRLGGLMPYARRVAWAGRLTAGTLAPLMGWRGRIRANLALVCPDLPPQEVERLVHAVCDNIGRSVAEIYSGAEFVARVKDLPLTGPGAALLAQLQAGGRPAVLVTGHFGNYDAWRGGLVARGYPIGALYRPMNNPVFNTRYVQAISRVAAPIFPRDKRGMAQMLRHLREGGMVGLAIDQFFHRGARLQFFGRKARTPLSAAEIALRHGAPMIPIFATRQADGLSFVIEVEDPIAPDTPEAMSQRFNDILEAKVRARMDQWLWIHQRWKA